MTTVKLGRIAAIAEDHIGDASPVDTCLSLGMNKWPQELGLLGIGTNSVSEAERRARAGYNGWTYHEDLAGVRVDDFVDWEPAVLGGSDRRHASVVHDIDDRGRIRTIGAGGPTGHVFWQPQSKGYNPQSYFRGYFRPPHDTPAATKPQTASSPTTQQTYTVKRGDTLTRIATKHGSTVGKLVKLNKLRNADHIEVGQKLRLR